MTARKFDFDFNIVTACLSKEMIDKLEYACQTVIQELLILKNDEKEKGNKNTYSWLNIVDHRGRIPPITRIIDTMFEIFNLALLLSVISDYVDPQDVHMLKIFSDNYYIHKYKCSQAQCEQIWRYRLTCTPEDFNPTTYPTMMFKHGMYYYMQLNTEFVRHNLFNVLDNNNNVAQLK